MKKNILLIISLLLSTNLFINCSEPADGGGVPESKRFDPENLTYYYGGVEESKVDAEQGFVVEAFILPHEQIVFPFIQGRITNYLFSNGLSEHKISEDYEEIDIASQHFVITQEQQLDQQQGEINIAGLTPEQ